MAKIDIFDTLTEQEQDAKDIFFGLLGNYAKSTEMITTWLGQDAQNGGTLVIPWNDFVHIYWKCVGIAKGVESIPPEIKAYLDKHRDDFMFVNV